MAIDSRYKLKTGEEVAYFPPIQNTATPYSTEAAMYADQANQLEGYGYLVDGVGAFTYLGTVAGTAADYEGFGGGVAPNAGNGISLVDNVISLGNLTQNTDINAGSFNLRLLQVLAYSLQTKDDWGQPYGIAEGSQFLYGGGSQINTSLSNDDTNQGISLNQRSEIYDLTTAQWGVAISTGTVFSQNIISEIQIGSDYFRIRLNGLFTAFPSTYSGANVERVLPISVNGEFANTAGNITIPVGTSGLDLRASNLAGDLSTAEKDGIKNKVDINSYGLKVVNIDTQSLTTYDLLETSKTPTLYVFNNSGSTDGVLVTIKEGTTCPHIFISGRGFGGSTLSIDFGININGFLPDDSTNKVNVNGTVELLLKDSFVFQGTAVSDYIYKGSYIKLFEIFESPNGTLYKVGVDDTGARTSIAL